MVKFNDVRKNENKGFSLVELIVVIAIMAVMTAVLAPSLLAYVERSRAQKDDSAMAEVTNAVLLGMSDQQIFDEVLYYSAYGNVSCYIDVDNEATLTAAAATNTHVGGQVLKTETKAETTRGGSVVWKQQYTFGDNARLADEKVYWVAGNMRGMTITFQPEKSSNESTFVLANGVINKFIENGQSTTRKKADGTTPAATVVTTTIKPATGRAADTKTYINADPAYAGKGFFGDMASGSANGNTYLYNRVRATVGNEIKLTSQTYRNSEYTIFIRMGSTGGNAAAAQDAIAVYGQWNGTNLPANRVDIGATVAGS